MMEFSGKVRRKQGEAREKLSELERKKRQLEELIKECKRVDIVSWDEEVGLAVMGIGIVEGESGC